MQDMGAKSILPVDGAGGAESKARSLVPWDVGLDKSGNTICPIPDYTIAALVYDIAEEKGNNITVIFDCCHSASSTRGMLNTSKLPFVGAPPLHPPVDFTPSGSARVRYVAPSTLPPLNNSLEEASLSKAASRSATLPRRGMRSHVLLAACGHAELAFECTHVRNGYFTDKLLQVLRSNQIDKLTYKSCMANFPCLSTPQPQNPVCEVLFNATVPSAHRSFIPIMETAEEYVLSAGIAQGIAPGSKFSVHAESVLGPDNSSLGTLVAEPLLDNTSRSICKLDQDLEHPGMLFARSVDLRADTLLNVMCTDSLNQIVPDASTLLSNQSLVTSRDSAHLILGANQQTSHITFELLDPLWNALGLSVLPHTVLPNSDIIKHVLGSMTTWRWYYFRVSNERPFVRAVQVEFYQLRNFGGHLEPVGEDLNKGGTADVQASPNDMFGFKITNNSRRPLYAYLFFFSTVDQSIRPLFLKVFGSASIDPLEVGASLTLGYHNDDLDPLRFDLGQTALVIGKFRLFVTPSPADFESVAQPSPFTALSCVRPGEDEFVNGVCCECGSWREHGGSDSVLEPGPEPELEPALEPELTVLVPDPVPELALRVEPPMVELPMVDPPMIDPPMLEMTKVETTLVLDSEPIILASEPILAEVPDALLPEIPPALDPPLPTDWPQGIILYVIEPEPEPEPMESVPDRVPEPAVQAEPLVVEPPMVEPPIFEMTKPGTTLVLDSEPLIPASEPLLDKVSEILWPEIPPGLNPLVPLSPPEPEPLVLGAPAADFEVLLALSPEEMWDVIDMQIVLRNFDF